jgi:hypothetical protein
MLRMVLGIGLASYQCPHVALRFHLSPHSSELLLDLCNLNEVLRLSNPLFHIIFKSQLIIVVLLKDIVHVLRDVLIELASHHLVQDSIPPYKLTSLAL